MTTMEWVAAAWIALIITLVVVFGVQDCDRRSECEHNGGTVERYNYRTVWMAVSCGSNCMTMVPVETSDWRCVHPAERAP